MIGSRTSIILSILTLREKKFATDGVGKIIWAFKKFSYFLICKDWSNETWKYLYYFIYCTCLGFGFLF